VTRDYEKGGSGKEQVASGVVGVLWSALLYSQTFKRILDEKPTLGADNTQRIGALDLKPPTSIKEQCLATESRNSVAVSEMRARLRQKGRYRLIS